MSPTGGRLHPRSEWAGVESHSSEYDLKMAVKALSSTGESENFDEDDSSFDEKEVMKDLTIFGIVANLMHTGLDRIFMSKDHKTHVKRRVVYLSGKPLATVKSDIEAKCKSVSKDWSRRSPSLRR